jgi:hypothetical protein
LKSTGITRRIALFSRHEAMDSNLVVRGSNR